MPFVLKMIEFDGALLKKFVGLSHEFRKRVLKSFFAEFKIVIERLKQSYEPVLIYESCRLETMPIQIQSRKGMRIDLVIKLRINKQRSAVSANRTMRLGY
jgi:hypothetical protein